MSLTQCGNCSEELLVRRGDGVMQCLNAGCVTNTEGGNATLERIIHLKALRELTIFLNEAKEDTDDEGTLRACMEVEASATHAQAAHGHQGKQRTNHVMKPFNFAQAAAMLAARRSQGGQTDPICSTPRVPASKERKRVKKLACFEMRVDS